MDGNYAEGGGWEQLKIDRPMRVENECSEGYMNMGKNLGNDGMPPIARPRRRRIVQLVVIQLP